MGRVRHGDRGLLPVILGLAVIWTILQTQNDRFLSPQNLSNLALQSGTQRIRRDHKNATLNSERRGCPCLAGKGSAVRIRHAPPVW